MPENISGNILDVTSYMLPNPSHLDDVSKIASFACAVCVVK